MSDLLIDARVLVGKVPSSDWLIFDVRHDLADHGAGKAAYDQGHIPGAIFLDHERQLSAPKTGRNGRHPLPSVSEFAALMRSQGLTPQTQVVAYDGGNGMYASHLWWMLRWLGHDKVAVLDGGWPAWLSVGGASDTVVTVPVSAGEQVAAGQAAMPTVDVQAVLSNIKSPAFTVVDARAANRYRGEIEPMDPVAGHIPGALNRPSLLNVQEDGRFKPVAQLRSEFETLLQGVSAQNVVHQCGSGISACHNLFAMELAGLSGSAVYPGSWSEWCSDPSRPVARG